MPFSRPLLVIYVGTGHAERLGGAGEQYGRVGNAGEERRKMYEYEEGSAWEGRRTVYTDSTQRGRYSLDIKVTMELNDNEERAAWKGCRTL